MKIAVVGAGAMGGSYGGHLARTGHDVLLVDTWREHVERINRDGLALHGLLGTHRVPVPASETADRPGWADLVIVFVDANSTRVAAQSAVSLRAPDGVVVTFQNGVGNVEVLEEVVGAEHVLGGSSMCSAAMNGPGAPNLTHLGPTSVGELDDGALTPRLSLSLIHI